MFAEKDVETVCRGAAIRGGVPPTGLLPPSVGVWWASGAGDKSDDAQCRAEATEAREGKSLEMEAYCARII